jgi:hypothetical protein
MEHGELFTIRGEPKKTYCKSGSGRTKLVTLPHYYPRFEKETVSRDSCLFFSYQKTHTWSPDQALKPSQIWLQIHRDTVR